MSCLQAVVHVVAAIVALRTHHEPCTDVYIL